MLTSDLVQTRKKGDIVEPKWLTGPRRERMRDVATHYLRIVEASIGRPREEVDAELDAVAVGVRDRLTAAGVRKLVLDRCTFEGGDELAAQALRSEVFLAAAAVRSALGPTDAFDRDAILAQVASTRGIPVEDVERGLFADLRSAERLVALEPIAVEPLLAHYDVALAQALLLRASKVTIEVRGESPDRFRKLFRAASFHGLLHTVAPLPLGGHRIELDGPMSIFDAVQRYGLRLALFFPHVLACRDFTLEAEIVWGPKRERRRFGLASDGSLAAAQADLDAIPERPEIAALLAAWADLDTPWRAKRCERLIALPGEVVVAPDVVFEHARTGEEVLLEVFGFWSRVAVFNRIEQIRRGLGGRMILAVGKHLRVSQELLDEEDGGELHVYKTAISARAILARLDRQKPS